MPNRVPFSRFTINRHSPQAADLIAWLPGMASRGSKTVLDLSGYKNDGLFPGGTAHPIWSADARGGMVLNFDGSDDYVDAGNNAVITGQSAVTVTFWINADEWKVSDLEWILGKGNSGQSQREWGFRHEDPNLVWRVSNNGENSGLTRANIPISSVPIGKWWHICGTWTTGTNNHKVYLNGDLIDQNTNNAAKLHSSTGGLYLGWITQGAAGRTFHGLIDDLRIYNRILTPAESKEQFGNPWDLFLPLPKVHFVSAPAVGTIVTLDEGGLTGGLQPLAGGVQ